MTFKLPDMISSPQDLTTLLLELREYSQWYEHESIKQRRAAAEHSVQPVLSPETITMLRAINNAGPLRPEQLEALISELEAYKLAAPTIAITLAAPATKQVKKELTTWCRTELSPDTLVAFDYNRTLLGGMVVRYNSHVFDWSFKRQLADTPVRFSEVLARV